MITIEKIEEIEERIKFVEEVTSWSPVPSGSVLRVPAYSYMNWGIGITPENIEWLYRKSNESYSVEWQDTDATLNALVAEAAKNAGLGDTNANMNDIVGRYSAEYLREISKKQKSFVLIDVGAGAGATTIAVIRAMIKGKIFLEDQSRLILIEPSESRLNLAKQSINLLLKKNDVPQDMFELVLAVGRDVQILSQYDAEFADIIVSNASIHHNAFNYCLTEINRVLKSGGPFINGDWHNSMWETPARVYWLLLLLRQNSFEPMSKRALISHMPTAEQNLIQLKEWRKEFSLSYNDVANAFSLLTPNQYKANIGIIKFWIEVGKIFSEKGLRAPIFFLEAHETVEKRIMNLKNAGFVFDEECKQKYVEMLREKGGELAAVMVAKKMRR